MDESPVGISGDWQEFLAWQRNVSKAALLGNQSAPAAHDTC